MDVDHTHMGFFAWIKANWHWLAGSTVGIFYTLRWTVKNAVDNAVLSKHPTHEDLSECKIDVVKKLDEHEQREFTKYEGHRKENADAHKAIGDKIDHIKDIIIENLRKKHE